MNTIRMFRYLDPPRPSLFREGGRLQIFGKSIAYSKNIRKFAAEKEKGDTTMATAIKAIPTLKGKEAREFLHRAEEVERDFKGDKNKDQHPLCRMAHEILSKAGML